jgi:hypothetical protein
VSSGRNTIYIVGLSVFWEYYPLLGIDIIILLFIGGIHVAGSREQKRVELYGKYDYYLIFIEKHVRSYGLVI